MQVPSFFGGFDSQRSSNLYDNRLINLIPVTNDRGDVTGFVSVPGLREYLSIPGGSIASGIYVASNKRCFMVAGTTFYEILLGAVLVNRGSITNSLVTRFSDNGIDLIAVNGNDGWLFNFASNTLTKISVHQAVFTVTSATPAVFSSINHRLVLNDVVRLSTTGALYTGLATLTDYYVIATGLTTNNFELSLTLGGTAVNTAGVQSGIHTFTTIGFGFPEGCKTVSYMDGRFIACEPNTQNFYVSGVLDGKRWDALNIQNVDSTPDNVVGQVVSHNELIVFGETSGEVFYDSGTVPTPFVRNPSGIFDMGCVAPYSIAKIDNSVMWLGGNDYGKGIIYRLNGYTPTRISTYSIEASIQAMSNISDALAFSYQDGGHHFYVITFPSGGKTFAFDVNTQLWHPRANFIDGSFTRWEAQEYAFFDSKHLVCDYSDGKIYSIDQTYYQNGIEPLKWLRSFRAPSSEMKRAIHHKLTIDAEVGTGLIDGTEMQIMMRYSDDGGHTWSNKLLRSMGAIGEYSKRIFWNRLGMTKGQPRIYEISGTAPTRVTLIGAYLE